jgi:peptidoglycan/xylan/chitin deacetylase (PgdA/CDA1 family)
MRISCPRLVGISLAPLALCASLTGAQASPQASSQAADCSGNPNAIGTSRTIVVDPREHRRIGVMSYSETLPLVDKEVVLTFDDGPLPPYTNKILDILAAQCVKATYFIVGVMARKNPELVRRVYDHGHTVGTHSMSHPILFRRLGLDEAKQQVDGGVAATAAALGDATRLAPFFRFPGFGKSDPVEAYLMSQGLMIWGADMPADDWRKIGGREVAKRAIQRLEAKGKGVLLLHDIHQRTVDALPIILSELKQRGFRIVHVVPATADRPATTTVASDWQMNSRRKASPPIASLPKTAMAGPLDTPVTMPQNPTADELRPAKPRSRGRHVAMLDRHKPSRHHHHGRHVRPASPDRHSAR